MRKNVVNKPTAQPKDATEDVDEPEDKEFSRHDVWRGRKDQ